MTSWFTGEYQNVNISEYGGKIKGKKNSVPARNFSGHYNLLLTLWRSQTGSERI